ncbi:ComEA family DNA-binding protein [Spirillospora sp. CA-255316]
MRARAAAIARDTPQMALEMRIGRPDLPRTYDDGGLVDINHAPASAFMTIPGMTPEQAERVVALRNDLGGLSSAEEVSALAELPPALTPRLAEHGIFLR